MRHILFQESDTNTYDVALLIKSSCFLQRDLELAYLKPLNDLGIPSEKVIGFTLAYNDQGKAPSTYQKDYLQSLLPVLDRLGVKYLYCCDANYFKTLTKEKKAEPHYGYTLPCKIAGYEHMQVILGVNHQALIYNPDLQQRLTLANETVANLLLGTYVELGHNVISDGKYPTTLEDISETLDWLLQFPALECDIETFGLRFNECGIGSIAFSYTAHKGVAFLVDYVPFAEPIDGQFGTQRTNHAVRNLLKRFFQRYTGKLTFHNAGFDIKVLVYQLWMFHPQDWDGLLTGLACLTKYFEDTKIIAYLATNSTRGNQLSLKYLAHEFAGNWAQDEIKDIRRIPPAELLRYNLVDALSTRYVRDKYWPILYDEHQEKIYYELLLPSLRTIIQMELVGLPLNMERVAEVRALLETSAEEAAQVIRTHPLIPHLNVVLQTNAMEAANAKLKKKQHPLEHFSDVTFNPNSGPQLQILLYELMGLPVIDFTETRQPATGADTLEKLIHHTQDANQKALIQALIDLGKINKILSTFIPAFEQAVRKGDGWAYLHGSFNVGGTVSGRLSSSDPNLQNLPSKSLYGKLIKTCVQAPPGWLFCGADFMSLEDRINALLTKDPQKLKVYTDGFDGHSLRTYAYFKELMPDVQWAELTERCFRVVVNNTVLLCKSGDFIVLPNGTKIPVEEYFDSHQRL